MLIFSYLLKKFTVWGLGFFFYSHPRKFCSFYTGDLIVGLCEKNCIYFTLILILQLLKRCVKNTSIMLPLCKSSFRCICIQKTTKILFCAFSQRTQIALHLGRRVLCLHDTLKQPVTIVPTILKDWSFLADQQEHEGTNPKCI